MGRDAGKRDSHLTCENEIVAIADHKLDLVIGESEPAQVVPHRSWRLLATGGALDVHDPAATAIHPIDVQ
jgi:hypothetical protein